MNSPDRGDIVFIKYTNKSHDTVQKKMGTFIHMNLSDPDNPSGLVMLHDENRFYEVRRDGIVLSFKKYPESREHVMGAIVADDGELLTGEE
jgi:nitrous oxide reductase accessory protein NosL